MTDDRAEAALRTALARAADEYDVVPLASVTPRRRRRWPALVAAAAVLVLVGSVTFVAARDGSSAPDVAADPGVPGGLPDGWHWESSRDAMVGVPDSWGYAYAPDDQWCVREDESTWPTEPFVDLHSPLLASTDVGCFMEEGDKLDDVPERLLTTHLSFLWHDPPPEGTRTWRGWTQITRHVGSAVIQVLADAEHLEVAEQVVDSARVTTVDPNGCPTRGRIQEGDLVRPDPAFDVTDVAAVDRAVVCQYLLPEHGSAVAGSGLVASRRMSDAEADAWLAGVQAAPTGGGPDRPQNCAEDSNGSWAVTVRLTTDGETRELYVYYSGCRGNGTDDGTTLRRLTSDTCAPLFGDRLNWGGGQSAVAKYCS